MTVKKISYKLAFLCCNDISNNDFYNTIKKLKLKTFSNLTATKKVMIKGKEVMMRADKELLGRMVIIGKDRALEPKEIFSHLLGPIP